jgi:hypothetical protein
LCQKGESDVNMGLRSWRSSFDVNLKGHGLSALHVAIALATFFTALCLIGCGGHGRQAPPSSSGIDELVIGLEQGASIDEVTTTLGPPVSETESQARTELNYGRWQLTFAEGRLDMRVRVRSPKGASRSENTPAESAVLGMWLGTPLREVRARFGVPSSIYEEYEVGPEPVVVLRYGSWQLTFEHGKLSQRAR